MGHLILATKTLDAIESAIKSDQGSAYRQHLGRVIPHIGDAYRGADEAFRSHLGASLIGRACGRDLWYSFRWATKPVFSGRIIRLFNRGHMEEARFIAMLLTIGCEVYQQDANGKQYRISDAAGHFGGSGDGIAIGLPDLPAGTPALLEFKTHGESSFKELKTKGVRDAKFEHFVQMQVYLRRMGLVTALYLAVNKNTDELHGEIVHLDSVVADTFIERAATIIWATKAPAKLSNSPGWFECKFCDHRPVCHLKAPAERNCRTCTHSRPTQAGNGTWHCALHDVELTKAVQLVGCDSYDRSPEV